MLGRLYEGQVCSAARALELVGERWSLLIVRNAMFAGMTRFTDFQRSLGVAPNILAKRLAEFVEAGLFEQRGDEGKHAEYVLTEKGLDLQPVIIALSEWGDRYAAPDGRPITYEHEGCDGRVALRLECTKCGESPSRTGVRANLAHKFRHARYGWTEPSQA